jgi:hypothetical protein
MTRSYASRFYVRYAILTPAGKVTKKLSNKNSLKLLSVAKLKSRSEASRQK